MITISRGNHVDGYVDSKNRFMELFSRQDGTYIRSGVINDNVDSGIDPFMRSYPNLLDVGIMGSCQHGKSGLCIKAGVQCYQDGLHRDNADMSYADYQSIVEQVKGKVQQIALGGAGDPNKHKFFGDILKLTVSNGIVPNYTTSGLSLTDREVALTKAHCGAVAVSWYRSQYTLDALDAFTSAGIITNIHYVLSNSSIDEAIARLEHRNFFGDGKNRINAVIFLLHKPVGLGSQDEVLQPDNPKVKRFFELIDNWDGDFQIGFDSCSIPGILNFAEHIDLDSVDTCEGARFSAYIAPDMTMTPCSFDQELKYGVSLNEFSIQQVWDSDNFNGFRRTLHSACPGCEMNSHCGGGCPLKQEIVLCNREARSEN